MDWDWGAHCSGAAGKAESLLDDMLRRDLARRLLYPRVTRVPPPGTCPAPVLAMEFVPPHLSPHPVLALSFQMLARATCSSVCTRVSTARSTKVSDWLALALGSVMLESQQAPVDWLWSMRLRQDACCLRTLSHFLSLSVTLAQNRGPVTVCRTAKTDLPPCSSFLIRRHHPLSSHQNLLNLVHRSMHVHWPLGLATAVVREPGRWPDAKTLTGSAFRSSSFAITYYPASSSAWCLLNLSEWQCLNSERQLNKRPLAFAFATCLRRRRAPRKGILHSIELSCRCSTMARGSSARTPTTIALRCRIRSLLMSLRYGTFL